MNYCSNNGGEKTVRLTLSVSCHEMTFMSKITTMGTQKSVKAMIMYPKRSASFPSICFFPRSLAPGVRRHTAPTISGGLPWTPPVEAAAQEAPASATRSTVRRAGGGLPEPCGAVCGAEAVTLSQTCSDTVGLSWTPRLNTFFRCCLTTLNIRT